MHPVKIGIDARLWNETGVGRYIRNLVVNLQEIDKQNDYILFVLSKDKEIIQSHISNPKFHIKIADIRWHSLKEQMQFGNILKKEQLDLVHFPYFSVPVVYNRPFVVTIHDLILHHFPTGKASTLPSPLYWAKHAAYKGVVALAAKNAKKIITVSYATAKEIADDLHMSDEKIVVTYEGVDRNLQVKQHEESEGGYFLYVGNAYPHKNLERLLHGFRIFKTTDRKDIKLLMVGKKDYFYRGLTKQVIALGLEDDVIFKHTVDDEELASLYVHAEALVVPSLMEGFGLPGLEAMNNNCLVLASDIPSLKEIYDQAAIYFDPYSPKAIANVLTNVVSMNNKEKSVFLQNGQEQVKKYSWKQMAAQTLKVYESCIGI